MPNHAHAVPAVQSALRRVQCFERYTNRIQPAVTDMNIQIAPKEFVELRAVRADDGKEEDGFPKTKHTRAHTHPK